MSRKCYAVFVTVIRAESVGLNINTSKPIL